MSNSSLILLCGKYLLTLFGIGSSDCLVLGSATSSSWGFSFGWTFFFFCALIFAIFLRLEIRFITRSQLIVCFDDSVSFSKHMVLWQIDRRVRPMAPSERTFLFNIVFFSILDNCKYIHTQNKVCLWVRKLSLDANNTFLQCSMVKMIL